MRLSSIFAALLAVLVSPAAAEDPRLSDFAFMEGTWRGDNDGLHFEEIWSSPAAGVMAGMARGHRDGRIAVLEYILVTEEAEGVFMRFKHFNTDYSTWETDGAIELRFVAAKDGDALFRNDDPDAEVQAVRYRLTGEGEMEAAVELYEDGERGGFKLSFRKAGG